MTPNSHKIPGDQRKKNTVKIEKYLNCLSDRKISSGERHSFFFFPVFQNCQRYQVSELVFCVAEQEALENFPVTWKVKLVMKWGRSPIPAVPAAHSRYLNRKPSITLTNVGSVEFPPPHFCFQGFV